MLQATNENNGQENEAEQVNGSVVTSGVTSKDNSYVKDVADLDRFIDKTSRDGVAKKETLASSSNLQEQTTDKKEMLVATNDIDDQPKKAGEN